MSEKIDRAALRALCAKAGTDQMSDTFIDTHAARVELMEDAISTIPALLDAFEASEARDRRLMEALRSMQIAAAAGLDIVRDESSPVFEFLAAIHRHSTAALIADAEPTNEAETAS